MPATENRCRFLHLQGGNSSKAQSGRRWVLLVVIHAVDRLLVRVPVRMPIRMSDHHSDRILSRRVVRTVFGTQPGFSARKRARQTLGDVSASACRRAAWRSRKPFLALPPRWPMVAM